MLLRKYLSHFCCAVAVAASALLLCSCEDKQMVASLAEMEEHLAELEQTKAKLETTLKSERAANEKRQRDLIKENEALRKESEEIRAQFERLEDEVAQVREELRDYKAKYKEKARGKLKGQTLARLETTDKVAYERVTIREVTPEEVSIAHTSGIARVPLVKLSRNLQQKFLYDPEEVKALEEARVAAASATEDLEAGEGVQVEDLAKIKQKDPQRVVNQLKVANYKKRIQERQRRIRQAHAEVERMKKTGLTDTNLGKYRLEILRKDVARWQSEIKKLMGMLQKELNG